MSQTRPRAKLVSASEFAYGELCDRILLGDLAPGIRLDPAEIAQSLEISITPLREAFVRLQAEGLVEIAPRKGVVVTQLSLDDLSQLYQLRQVLERLACGFIISNVTDSEIRYLEELLAETVRSAAGDRITELLRLNREFHRVLYWSCRNKYLATVLTDLREQSARYIYHVLRHRKIDHQTASRYEPGHHAIIQALKKRDLEDLLKAVEYDMVRTVEQFKAYLENVALASSSERE